MSIKKFTIDRSKWLNGELYKRYENADKDAPEGQLKDHSGRMCCLGFYSQACGVVGLRSKSMPDELASKERDKLDFYIINNQYDYSGCNDNTRLTTTQRESKLKELFAKRNIKVTFKGKYPVIKK